MNFLLTIFRFFPYGGLQKDFLRIAETLAARGHGVTVFTSSWEGAEPEGISIVKEPVPAWTNHGFALEFERRFRRFAAASRFDRTLTFNRIGGADFYFAADDCFRMLLEKRSPLVRLLPRSRVFLEQERKIFAPGVPTRILYITERQKQDFQRLYGTEEERFVLLSPAGDPRCGRRPPDVRIRKRKELGIPETEFLLIQVAADFACKGTDRLLKAFASLEEPLRKHVTLLLAGGGTESRRKPFRRLAEKTGIAGKVIFAGPRSDVPELLAAADLMVHPARKESAGSVLVEALTSGLPVICSDACGFETYVRAAGCPVLPEPFSQTGLNAELRHLLSVPEAYSALRRNAEKAAERLDLTLREKEAADALENIPVRNP